MAGRETIALRKRARRSFDIRAVGYLTVEAEHRQTGQRGSATEKNTILSLETLIELVAQGTANRNALSQANAGIVIRDTDADTGAVTYEKHPADQLSSVPATFTDGSRRQWRFDEKTATEYFNLNYAELWNGDNNDTSLGHGSVWQAITRVPCAQAIKDAIDAAGGPGALGHKPTDYNLIFRYEIELYSLNTKIKNALNNSWMLNIVGGGSLWTNDKLRITPQDGLGADVGTAKVATSRSFDADSITAVFDSLAGENTGGEWANVKMEHLNTALVWEAVRLGGCRADGGTCGEKGANDEWTYEWTYTLSEG